MVRPLQKTYNPKSPYVVEKREQEDGSITWEIWDQRPDSYRRVCYINDGLDYDDEAETRTSITAHKDAKLIAMALNAHGL